MVDINNQLLKLPINEAQEEIAKLIGLGYTDLILTFPILVNGEYDIEEMVSKFNMYKVNFKAINLYLGNEVYYHYSLIHRLKKHDILTLNGSEYILLKLPKEKKPEQFRQLIEALEQYKVIISCADEYKYLTYKDLVDLKKMNVLFLVDIKNIKKRKTKKLIKNHLVDYLVTYDNINHVLDKNFYNFIDKDYYHKITKDNYSKIINLPL